jgi:hypothetical protein
MIEGHTCKHNIIDDVCWECTLAAERRRCWIEGARYVDEEYGSEDPKRWDDDCPYPEPEGGDE